MVLTKHLGNDEDQKRKCFYNGRAVKLRDLGEDSNLHRPLIPVGYWDFQKDDSFEPFCLQ